jgi:hypothetical protein
MRMARLNSAVATGRRMKGAEMCIVGNPLPPKLTICSLLEGLKTLLGFKKSNGLFVLAGYPSELRVN